MATNNINFDQLADIFNQAGENVESKMMEGLTEISEDLLSVADQLAPLWEGGLMEGGSVDPPKKMGDTIQSRVGYSKEYALRRHEESYNLGPISAKKPNIDGMSVGQKYLEKPTKKYGDKYAEYLAEKSKEAF
ncbi:MAG: hypothetical protein LPK26_04700 [Bacillaceae bacterium]|nr:hypothetical protein [Bacillaceae bacterium]